jgi:hypothetical protein
MGNITSNGEGVGGCSSKDAPATCCQSVDEKVSSCCNPKSGSWSKGKALLAALIILAAIGVGAVSFMRENAAQSLAAAPAASCSTPCAATSCTNSGMGGTAAAEAPKPAPCCPTQSPGGGVSLPGKGAQ